MLQIYSNHNEYRSNCGGRPLELGRERRKLSRSPPIRQLLSLFRKPIQSALFELYSPDNESFQVSGGRHTCADSVPLVPAS